MRKELTLTELDTQIADLLPERETLTWGGNNNWAGVSAYNSSLALNAASYPCPVCPEFGHSVHQRLSGLTHGRARAPTESASPCRSAPSVGRS